MFWSCTPHEIGVLLEKVRKRNREAYIRAGLIAATIINVNKRPGARLVQPEDFLMELPRAEDFMSPEAASSFMDRWAASVNEEQGTVTDV